ncbi:hypothetical protein MASR2M41_21680 [Flammeovirgaceae bacterium]
MSLTATFVKKTFHFGFRAKTSRGVMRERDSWFIRIQEEGNDEIFGLGEAAPLPGLSRELDEGFESNLSRLVERFNIDKHDLPDKGSLALIS